MTEFTTCVDAEESEPINNVAAERGGEISARENSGAVGSACDKAGEVKIDLAPITLAFVGDAVFTLFVRERLALKNLKAGELTKRAARVVSAVSQSEILQRIQDSLTDGEKDIVRRCRNAHTNSHAKNASICEYRRATGLEGLIGHLHLSKSPRLSHILDLCLKESDFAGGARKAKTVNNKIEIDGNYSENSVANNLDRDNGTAKENSELAIE